MTVYDGERELWIFKIIVVCKRILLSVFNGWCRLRFVIVVLVYAWMWDGCFWVRSVNDLFGYCFARVLLACSFFFVWDLFGLAGCFGEEKCGAYRILCGVIYFVVIFCCICIG